MRILKSAYNFIANEWRKNTEGMAPKLGKTLSIE